MFNNFDSATESWNRKQIFKHSFNNLGVGTVYENYINWLV